MTTLPGSNPSPSLDPVSEILDLREAGADGGDLMGFYCRGHVTRREFAEACNRRTGAEMGFDIRHVRAEECHHVWWRTVPMSGQDGCAQYVAAEPGARGAWKATVWEGVTRARLCGLRDHVTTDRTGHRRGFAAGVSWALRTLENRHLAASQYLVDVWRNGGDRAEEQHLDRGVGR